MPWFAQIEPFAHHPGLGALVGYIFGCFTTGYYLVRWKTGQDIREISSGSCGARNVSRILGRNGFFLTVVGDVLKGVFAVLLTEILVGGEQAKLLAMIAVAAVSVLACIILTAHYRNVIQEINQLFARQPDIGAQPKAESTKS